MIIESEPRQKFKAVLFDMGGVLLRYKDPMAYRVLINNGKNILKFIKDLIFNLSETYPDVAVALNNFDRGIKSVEELPHLMESLLPGIVRL